MDITKQRLENSSFSFTFGRRVQCRSTAVISGFGLFVCTVLKVSFKRLFIQLKKNHSSYKYDHLKKKLSTKRYSRCILFLIYPVYWNIEHYILNTNPHVNVTVRLVQISAPDSSVCRQSTKLTRDSGRGGYGSRYGPYQPLKLRG